MKLARIVGGDRVVLTATLFCFSALHYDFDVAGDSNS